jgi:GNAT superfamily N-acetyltransferase
MPNHLTSKVRVRDFAEADREALRALFVAARDAAFVWDAPGEHRPEDFETATAGERILVAVMQTAAEEEVVGFASIWLPESFLHNLFVDPAHQRRGVGRALLAACKPYFRDAPTLKCVHCNENALRFYFAQGWTIRDSGVGDVGGYFLLTLGDSNS